MNMDQRRKLIEARVGQALNLYLRNQGEYRRQHLPSPRSGEIFAFAETEEFFVHWVVLERDSADLGRFLVVPIDLNPLLGSSDVAASAEASRGASSLRCRFGVWLRQEDFDGCPRTGHLEAEYIEWARRKRAEIERGTHTGSRSQREADEDPEYLDWVKEVFAPAQAALKGRHAATDDARWSALDGRPMEFVLHVDIAATTSAEEVDGLTRGLLSEIKEINVEWVNLLASHQALPVGAKSFGGIVPGVLAVGVLAPGLTSLAMLLKEWLGRGKKRRIKVRATSGPGSLEAELRAETLSVEELKSTITRLTDEAPEEEPKD